MSFKLTGLNIHIESIEVTDPNPATDICNVLDKIHMVGEMAMQKEMTDEPGEDGPAGGDPLTGHSQPTPGPQPGAGN